MKDGYECEWSANDFATLYKTPPWEGENIRFFHVEKLRHLRSRDIYEIDYYAATKQNRVVYKLSVQ